MAVKWAELTSIKYKYNTSTLFGISSSAFEFMEQTTHHSQSDISEDGYDI